MSFTSNAVPPVDRSVWFSRTSLQVWIAALFLIPNLAPADVHTAWWTTVATSVVAILYLVGLKVFDLRLASWEREGDRSERWEVYFGGELLGQMSRAEYAAIRRDVMFGRRWLLFDWVKGLVYFRPNRHFYWITFGATLIVGVLVALFVPNLHALTGVLKGETVPAFGFSYLAIPAIFSISYYLLMEQAVRLYGIGQCAQEVIARFGRSGEGRVELCRGQDKYRRVMVRLDPTFWRMPWAVLLIVGVFEPEALIFAGLDTVRDREEARD